MKHILLFVAMIMGGVVVMAQAPQKMTYQAVVRDSYGHLICNDNVGIRLTILMGSETGTAVYSQSETAHTNANGLLTVMIGGDGFETINWSSGVYYMKSEIDPNGGTNYILTTVQQMVSVPYALHAGTVDNVVGGVNITETQTLADVAALGNEVRNQIKQLSDPTESLDAVNLRTLNATVDFFFQAVDSIAHIIDSVTHMFDSIINDQNNLIDSLISVITNVPITKFGDTVATECDSFIWYENNCTTTGDYVHVFSMSGVDSIVTLHITIKHSTTGDTIATANESFTWYGTTYSESTETPTHTFSNAVGCDSVVTLHLTIIPLSNGFDENGASYATFSVADGRTVKFSKGNLQYTTTGTHEVAGGGTDAGTWRFAENQYDFVGNNNSNISASYDGWIDLFGWGTSGWNSGATCYQPWSTSTYYRNYYPGMDSTNSLTDSYAYSDWGVYNSISNGGNQPGLWRTMTYDEWTYLLFTRNTSYVGDTPNARFVKAKIGTTIGLMIFPDNFILPVGIVSPVNINATGTAEFTDNIYTINEWHLFESAGVVFIPASGSRYDGSSYSGGNCYYWSSTHGNNYYSGVYGNIPYSTALGAWYLDASPYRVKLSDYNRHCGTAVRLVKDAE